MAMKAQLGHAAPLLAVSDWVQGGPTNFDQLLGRVVLVEVFQVNCPGCFLYALPQAIALHQRYSDQGLSVLGVATAFEDFDKNNLENLTRLITTGEVVGATLPALQQQGLLQNARLPFRIPFPVAMDNLQKRQAEPSQTQLDAFIKQRIPDFDLQPDTRQQQIRRQVEHHFQALSHHAETFELFDLQGTPSSLLVDKQGVLRGSAFGAYPDLEARIVALLQE